MDESPSRRRYLLGVGSVVTSSCLATSGCLTNVGESTVTRHGITFDRVVNAVDDLGFDDNGTEPIDSAFADAYETGTLIEFPPGEYRIEAEQSNPRVSRFGVRGTGESRRDVRIRPSSGATIKWLKANDVGPHLVENMSFDERDDETTQLSLWITTTDGSVVKNVEWLGRTPDDSGIEYSLTAEVTDQEGVFTVEEVYAGVDQPAVEVEYPNGVAFLRSGPSHKGELRLRDSIIKRRNSNATRSTGGSGVLTIEGSVFTNNQNSNVRFGAGNHPSKVSSASRTYIRVDGTRDSADAIRLDGSGQAGAVFRNIDVDWTADGGRSVIAVPEWGEHGRAEFYDCAIRNQGSIQTVEAEPTPVEDSALIFENCSFTGLGNGFLAVERPGSVIRDSCIDMPNASINGFETQNLTRSNCRLPGTAPAHTSAQ